MVDSISAQQARAIAIGSQGLHTPAGSLAHVFASVKCIQLDPLKAIRESHELVCMARGVDAGLTESLLARSTDQTVFVYPAHAMALLPLEMWPWFAFLRRRVRAHGWRGPTVDPEAIRVARTLLSERQVVTSRDEGKVGSGWNQVSPLRIAMEWLLWTGEAISTSRKGTAREYALAVNVVPRKLHQCEPEDAECLRRLVEMAVDALGIATTEDVADYFRLGKVAVKEVLQELEVETAVVEGWKEKAWVSKKASTYLRLRPKRIVPLSPFDSLVWYRPRLARLFGKHYSFEAYKPANQRKFGHYFISVLSGDIIIGRIAPRRVKGEVVIEATECDSPKSRKDIDRAIQIIINWGASKQTKEK